MLGNAVIRPKQPCVMGFLPLNIIFYLILI